MDNFTDWFKKATNNEPYSFQKKLAISDKMPKLVDIPTGCGKTAGIILAWLWRRRFHPNPEVREVTSRRLVYCLPMRVLVEQTKKEADKWLKNLELADSISSYLLMGGEIDNDWDNFPEKEMILIGTQDQLLSRALNRGYAMSRARWPMHFGLLNNDCLWVMDEVQLMGTGLATTVQLEAFRNGSSGFQGSGTFDRCQSVWMSATIEPEWLETVNHPKPSEPSLSLSNDERQDESSPIGKRLQASKILQKANSAFDKVNDLAKEIIGAHFPGTLTLVIVNTVDRAVKLYEKIEKQIIANKKLSGESQPEPLLIHSRFRPPDRQKKIETLISEIPEAGRIVVATQVVEAGVDISAKNLFTELAPWPSLVQRLGRLNREGIKPDSSVFWIDLPNNKAMPYEESDLDKSREILIKYEGESLAPVNLPEVEINYKHVHVIRHKDLVELFDTTPDLAGNDLDISRFIREDSDHDVQVFWRNFEGDPSPDMPAAHRDELCSVSISEFRKFLGKKDKKPYRWNFLDGKWDAADNSVYPGQLYLLNCSDGGYALDKGWDSKSTALVDERKVENEEQQDSNDKDFGSHASDWQTIAEHTQVVCEELEKLLENINLDKETVAHLLLAARWHDRGKAHECFQTALSTDEEHQPGIWAKAPNNGPLRYKRDGKECKHFRHELASALAMIQADLPNISVYLAAAHHGKVRLSIRSFPGEMVPDNRGIRFARGVWDGDNLHEIDLGSGEKAPEAVLSLELMELGLSADGQPSWAERVLKLRDDPALGPFRLAYLEAILRIADWRGSAKEKVAEAVLEGSNVSNS